VTEQRRVILSSIGIMAAVSLSTAVIAIYVLYESGIEMHSARLKEIVQSRARIIEAMASFDAEFSRDDHPDGSAAATLSQVIEAHEKFEGFGTTGEFTLAKREDDQIVFLLEHRHKDVGAPKRVPFRSALAEPMRRALRGEDGTVVGLDYRGVEVLAAYEKIQGVDWGVVAKIDMAEIRQPFARAGSIVSGIALVAVIIGVGFILSVTSPLMGRIQARTRELQEAHERLRLHSSEASLAVERERRKLAVDLHDGLGQLLALANIKLGLLHNMADVEKLDLQIQEIESLITEACGRSREMTSELCPPILYEVGLVEALRWLADDMERRYGLKVTLEADGQRGPLDEATRISLFRSANELLINVAKHAQADTAVVGVSHWNQFIKISVEDTGIGFDSASGATGYGLFSVRERLHHLGGIVKMESVRGTGTRISLLAPLKSADSEMGTGLA
jgi:signal transduction histidine kinase